jgi:hypothetical protein
MGVELPDRLILIMALDRAIAVVEFWAQIS